MTDKNPFKRRYEIYAAIFVLAGAAATLIYAAGETWFG